MFDEIEDLFPGLAGGGYQITSQASRQYNCVAWALEITAGWWSHDGIWLDSVPRSPEAWALVQIFEAFGYAVCDSAARETGYEKVAVYALNGQWMHAARQLEDGQWSSKLGQFEDITHPSLESLAGELFGDVHCVMRRASA